MQTKKCQFEYLFANPLQLMSTWSPIDTTKFWASFLVLFFLGFFLLQLSSILLLVFGVFYFHFCLQQAKCSSVEFRSVDWLGLRRTFHFFSFQRKSPGSLSKSASGHCPSAMWSAVPWVLKQMIQTYTYTLFRIHIINKYMGTSSTSSHARWDLVTNNEQILSFSYVHLFLWL